MNLLSDKVKKIVLHYHQSDADTVLLVLQKYCEYMAQFLDGDPNPESYERFCLAIMKLGKSSKIKITQAIELGKIDYRDLLVGAGFGNSITLHNQWANKILSKMNNV